MKIVHTHKNNRSVGGKLLAFKWTEDNRQIKKAMRRPRDRADREPCREARFSQHPDWYEYSRENQLRTSYVTVARIHVTRFELLMQSTSKLALKRWCCNDKTMYFFPSVSAAPQPCFIATDLEGNAICVGGWDNGRLISLTTTQFNLLYAWNWLYRTAKQSLFLVPLRSNLQVKYTFWSGFIPAGGYNLAVGVEEMRVMTIHCRRKQNDGSFQRMPGPLEHRCAISVF